MSTKTVLGWSRPIGVLVLERVLATDSTGRLVGRGRRRLWVRGEEPLDGCSSGRVQKWKGIPGSKDDGYGVF